MLKAGVENLILFGLLIGPCLTLARDDDKFVVPAKAGTQFFIAHIGPRSGACPGMLESGAGATTSFVTQLCKPQ